MPVEWKFVAKGVCEHNIALREKTEQTPKRAKGNGFLPIVNGLGYLEGAGMKDTPRVLFINPWDKRIGPNRYLAEMLAADPALARNSIVVLPNENAAAEEYRALGCAVEVWEWATLVHISRSSENLQRVRRTHTKGVWFARRRMRALRPDAVMTNSENVWFGGMAARGLGIPHLQVFHALTLEHHWGERPYLIRGYLNWLGLWTTRFVGVSQTVEAMLRRNGMAAKRVRVVSNGLNLAEIRAASEGALPPEIVARMEGHSPILVTLGRISAMKGHDLLIEALAQVKQTFPTVLCLLGGAVLSSAGVEDTDAFFAELQERIRVLHLENHVAFLGEIEYAPALLKRADVYAQPSRTESFCRAVVEALDCGTPVAAFAAGALPEVVGGGGILVAPENVTALAAAIVRLADDSTLRAECVRAGQEHIRAFDVAHSALALRAALAEVLTG